MEDNVGGVSGGGVEGAQVEAQVGDLGDAVAAEEVVVEGDGGVDLVAGGDPAGPLKGDGSAVDAEILDFELESGAGLVLSVGIDGE